MPTATPASIALGIALVVGALGVLLRARRRS
jgi:LPXTG-motif cell wall-anchored protein